MLNISSFMWKSIRQYKWHYAIMLCAPIIGAIYEPTIFYSVKLMIDTINKPLTEFNYHNLLYPIGLYLSADILISGLWRVSQVMLFKSQPYVQRGIISNALAKVITYPYIFFQNTTSGSITSKIKGLLDGYSNVWDQAWYGITYWFFSCITTAVSIFSVNLSLGFIITGFALVFFLVNYPIAKQVLKLSDKASTAKHKIIGDVGDCISNIHTIKLFSSRKNEVSRLHNSISSDYIPQEQKLLKFRFMMGLINDSMAIITFFGMLILMIYLRRQNAISIGGFVFAFSMVLQFHRSAWQLLVEFLNLSDRIGDFSSSLTILNQYDSEYLSDKTNNRKVAPIPQPTHILSSLNKPLSVEFKNVSFGYQGDNSRLIFNKLNLQIKAGEKIGIVGYTGGGKTTLTNLLQKMLAPDSGQILIDGTDIATLDNDYIRQLIALIPQDISLFHRSLYDNITYGNPSVSPEEFEYATKTSFVDEFVKNMPDQYQTLVGERGVKLSGGQRQRIAIARAIIKNAPILILDEATSSLDSITEQKIQLGIEQIIQNKTVLAIAHRLSTLKEMDRLIVINQGQIIESGTHDELITQENSLYAKIWKTQYHV